LPPSPPPDVLSDGSPLVDGSATKEVSASAWLERARTLCPADQLAPLQLAWLGDAVWELHQRLRRCRQPGRVQELHDAVVNDVRAAAQAVALERLEPHLEEQEREWVRRGRNRAGQGPRRGEAGVYGRATGFETMVGWLFLQNPNRLAQLLDRLDETDP